MENLINKRCLLEGCFKTFKAFPSSKRRFCEPKCEQRWREKNATDQRPMSDVNSETESASVRDTPPIESIEISSSRSDERDITPTTSEKLNATDATTEKKGSSAVVPVQSLLPSVDCVESLETGALSSMTLLNKSGNRLLRLMAECVNRDDLEKSRDGVMRVDPSKVQQTIDLANALAHTLQIQANLIKAMSAVIKERP